MLPILGAEYALAVERWGEASVLQDDLEYVRCLNVVAAIGDEDAELFAPEGRACPSRTCATIIGHRHVPEARVTSNIKLEEHVAVCLRNMLGNAR